MAEAATNQFGKATLKTMDKAYKIENAARKAGNKLDEAGMKAFEKVYNVAKNAGPGATGRDGADDRGASACKRFSTASDATKSSP